MRIRVLFDIRTPLKRKMRIKKKGGSWLWVTFEYERLPKFCFFYGILGYIDYLREKYYDFPDKSVSFPYWTWLGAGKKKGSGGIDKRWL